MGFLDLLFTVELNLELAVFLSGHEIRVSTKVHTVDEDVGIAIQSGLVVKDISVIVTLVSFLIHLDELKLDITLLEELLEELLGFFGVFTVRHRVDHDFVGIYTGIDLRLDLSIVAFVLVRIGPAHFIFNPGREHFLDLFFNRLIGGIKDVFHQSEIVRFLLLLRFLFLFLLRFFFLA